MTGWPSPVVAGAEPVHIGVETLVIDPVPEGGVGGLSAVDLHFIEAAYGLDLGKGKLDADDGRRIIAIIAERGTTLKEIALIGRIEAASVDPLTNIGGLSAAHFNVDVNTPTGRELGELLEKKITNPTKASSNRGG